MASHSATSVFDVLLQILPRQNTALLSSLSILSQFFFSEIVSIVSKVRNDPDPKQLHQNQMLHLVLALWVEHQHHPLRVSAFFNWC